MAADPTSGFSAGTQEWHGLAVDPCSLPTQVEFRGPMES